MSTASASTIATTSQRSRILHSGSAGMLTGGLITIVGSMLPWVSTPFGALSGTSGPGLWTLACGFLAVAGGLLPYRRLALAHALVPGIGVAAIVVWQTVRLIQVSASTGAWGQILPSIGMVLAAGGSVLLLRTAARLWRAR